MPGSLQTGDIMCESNVFMEEEGDLTEVMQEVTRIEVTENGVVCHGLLGERKEIQGVKIIEANLLDHKIILGKKG
ncbi:MAG: CooT family nickel-binding protein [Thermoplasmata archaeon]|nr:MAG: CooT family nickel-binding protein [Thermoplasmata archaeon]